MIKRDKRGVTPVVATVLLISIVLILSVVIFLWSRNFIQERIDKEGRDISLSCDDVSFSVDLFSTGKADISNTGTVPLYGIEIREKSVGGGSVRVLAQSDPVYLNPGESDTGVDIGEDISSGETYEVIPILLGESESVKRAHVCDDSYAIEVVAS